MLSCFDALYHEWFNRWMKRIENVEVRWKLHTTYDDIFLEITQKRFSTILPAKDLCVLQVTYANYATDWIHKYMQIASVVTIYDFYQHHENYKISATLTNIERVFADEYIVSQIIRF